jgi:hypothetical protein
VQLGPDQRSWFVVFNNQPQYRLAPVPAGGRYSVEVLQTVNGRRLEKGNLYSSADEAIAGGLEDLREALGW